MDIKFYMELVKQGDQHPCKQKAWVLCRNSIMKNITVKVEVTDRHHQIPIYKEIWTWIGMLHNMVNAPVH